MRDSSPDIEPRAISPPICGRSRSKERKPIKFGGVKAASKKFVDDGGYEPVGKGRDEPDKHSSKPVAIKPLNQMSGAPTLASSKTAAGSKSSVESIKQALPPRKAFTALPDPPVVNRDTKPVAPMSIQGQSKGWQPQQQQNGAPTDDGGYEPVGQERATKRDYEDVQFKGGAANIPEYAKVDKSNKKSAESKEDKKAREKEEKERKQREEKEKKAAEKERKNKEKMEKEQREKEAKEKKAKEKQEKELKEKEEKERKLKEKQMKEKAEKEEKERLQKEKLEREQREKEKKQYEKELADRIKSEKEAKEKEEKAKKLKEKQEREQREKEEKERKLREKEENDKKLKERKEKAEKENKFLRPRDFVASEPNPPPPVIKVAESSSPEWGENAQESVFQHDQSLETNHQARITTPVQVQQDFLPPPPSPSIHEEESLDVHNQSFPENDEFDQFFNATGPTFTQQQPYFQDHDQDHDQQHMPVLEEPSMFLDSFGQPLSDKERKKKEKELKAQREKEEKERKKREKEEKKKEEKEKKLLAKQEKEEQDKLKKQKQKEEKLAKEQAEKEKKEREKNKNAKGLLEIAQEMRQEQNRYFDETPHLVNGVVNEDQPPNVESPEEDLSVDAPHYDLVSDAEEDNDFDAQFFVNESQVPPSIMAPTAEDQDEASEGRSRKDKASKKKGYVQTK